MRPGTTIYFIRHGETDWNAARRYQGQVDIPLNDKGRGQALRNGRILCQLLPQIADCEFVSSPLGRARETMAIIRTALGLAPDAYRVDPAIVELSYGLWEGVLQDDLPMIDPNGIAERSLDPFHWRPQNGESYADLLARTISWVDGVERDTVVASHGGVSRCLRAHLLGLDPRGIPELESPQDRVLVIRRGEMSWM
ncbi:MAG: histidine phosphatase family protein [Hyphomicrobium sp.]|nr:histidine phosphatase family protein [Hyphomicrobium sp.]